MTDEKKRTVAKDLYVRSYRDESEIADLLDLPMHQLTRWAYADKWEEGRKTILNTREEHLRLCHEQMSHLNMSIMKGAGFPTDKEALTQKRLAASIEHLETNVSPVSIIQVAKEFITWLPNDGDFAQRVMLKFDEFIILRLRATGMKIDGK